MTRPGPIDPGTGLCTWPSARPFPVGPHTLPELLASAARLAPDRPALVDGARTWTLRRLGDDVGAMAAGLAARGVRPGDRVVWSLPNVAELTMGLFATAHLGALFVGVNPSAAPRERDALVADAEPTLVVDADLAPSLVDRTRTVPPVAEHDLHTPVSIAYTSGTTGEPKGAVHTHHNALWQAATSLWTDPPRDVEHHGTPLPTTILNIAALGPVTALARLGVHVCLGSTRAADLAADVERHQLTHTVVVPTIVHDLVHREVDPTSLASLRQVLVGGAGSPVALRRGFSDRFGLRVTNSYGLTETVAGVVREAIDEPIVERAVGRAQPPVEVVVVDDADRPVRTGEDGEICVRAVEAGPWADCWTPMLGYWRRPDDTALALRGAMLHTGDIGRLDEHGLLEVVGRASTTIVRGGANVHPAEVERVLLEHPLVSGAAVYGIDDPRLGQRVAAAVEVTPGAGQPSEEALSAWCAARLSRHKVPEVIDVVDALPRNAMGKVVLADLRPGTAPPG